jgi:type IV secretion system protein VirD4
MARMNTIGLCRILHSGGGALSFMGEILSLFGRPAVSATKILWGQITIVVLIVLATTWAATQWTAWRLGYQPQLGHPWFQIVQGMPVYLPPAFFWWWYAYGAYAPAIFLQGACIAASGGLISIVVAIGMSVWRARETRTIETYGSARWATPREVNPARLGAPGRGGRARVPRSFRCRRLQWLGRCGTRSDLEGRECA